MDDYDSDGSSGDEGVGVAVPTGRKKDVRYKGKDGAEGTRERVILKLRACLACRVIMSEDQFYHGGCPNCRGLHLDGNQASILENTTTNFSGMIALLRPDQSWVARFNRLKNRVPGCYALTVVGELPDASKDDLGYDRR